MHIKGVIFDLDNTLYNYDEADQKAYQEVFNYLDKKNDKTKKTDYKQLIIESKEEIKRLNSISHSRLLYFQNLCEHLQLSYTEAQKLNIIYWETFYASIKIYPYVKYLFDLLKKLGIKIGILTNFTVEHQFKKLQLLNLLSYIDHLVTSEEVGYEKPDKRMFDHILEKMNIPISNLMMIGDNFVADIEPLKRYKIYGGYFQPNNTETDINEDYLIFNNFKQLYKLFIDLYKATKELFILCNRYGQRFDLTQAGGGNISVKFNFADKHQLQIIKASGTILSDVTDSTGYVITNVNSDQTALKKLIYKTDLRPSIETAMHSILSTYTVHLHMIQAIKLLIKKDAEKIITKLFPESLYISYKTPGQSLADEIKNKYKDENMIFLQNHGVIFTTNDITQFDNYIRHVSYKSSGDMLDPHYRYKFVNEISDHLENIYNKKFVTYLIEDLYSNNPDINDKILDQITTPDKLVYCGETVCKDITELTNIIQPPSLVVYKKHLFSVGYNMKKCREIADVWKAHSFFNRGDDLLELDKKEIKFLSNWDAEKYRKKL